MSSTIGRNGADGDYQSYVSACAAPTATWRRLAWSWQALKVPVKCGDGDRGGNGDRGADGHGDDVGDFQPL